MCTTFHLLVTLGVTMAFAVGAEPLGEQESVVLRGLVLDSEGNPVPEVLLQCWWMHAFDATARPFTREGAETWSDEKGEFLLFTLVPENGKDGFLVTHHPDFGMSLTHWSVPDMLAFEGAASFEDLPPIAPIPAGEWPVLELPERIAVTGSVIDHVGSPVPGAEVSPLLAMKMRSPRSEQEGDAVRTALIPDDLFPILSAVTDANGRFTLDGMPASAPFGLQAWHGETGLGFAGYDPGLAESPRLRLVAEDAPVTLALSAPGTFSGQVDMAEGSERPARIVLVADRASRPETPVLDVPIAPDGSYAVGPVAAGGYTLEAVAPALLGNRVTVTVEPGKPTVASIITLGQGATIAGKVVHGESGAIVPEAKLRFAFGYQGEELVNVEPDIVDGRFSFNVRPGTVWMSPVGLNGLVQENTRRFNLLLDHGVVHDGLLIEYVPQQRITGRVLLPGGAPAAGAIVEARGLPYTRADAAGQFSFEVHADTLLEEMVFGATHGEDPPLLGIGVRPSGMEATDVTIEVEEACEVTGITRDFEGDPVNGIPVVGMISGVLGVQTISDADGRIRLYPLCPGGDLVILPRTGPPLAVAPMAPGETRDIGTVSSDRPRRKLWQVRHVRPKWEPLTATAE